MVKFCQQRLKYVLLGCLVSFFACQQTANQLGIHLNLDQRKLSNGLNVVLVEDHTVPVISFQSWFRVGSVDEHPGITGISHLFEHLMFKGTPKYGPREFFLQLEAKGAEVNAYTTRDYTVYYESFSPELLEKAIDMESDRLANLNMTKEILNTEKLVVFEERKLRNESSPEGKMQEALWQLAFRQHPYHWPVIGFPEDILRIKLEDLKEYFGTYYQPKNLTLVVVGNFKADATFELIKKYYGQIPSRERPKRDIPLEPEQTEERRLILRDRVASERFAHAYPITAANHDDSYALDVLANILFEGSASRARRVLMDEKDLVLGISGTAYTPAYPGLFMILGTLKEGIASEKVEQALNLVIQKVQEGGVTEEEVQKAVKQLTVQLVDSVRTPFGLGQLIGTVQMIFENPNKFADDLAKYTKVKPSDVQRVAQTYLQPNHRSVVNLVPGP